jgi:hypothetical protein
LLEAVLGTASFFGAPGMAHQKKPQHFCWGLLLAEREGFEPYVSEGQSRTVEENQQVII